MIQQDYDDLEYIVIDGASTDGTLFIIKKYLSNISVFLSEPDKGIFDAMNKGLDLVTGKYVLFMNSGDKFVNSHIVSDIFNGCEHDEDLIYGDTYVENSLGLKLGKADAIYLHNPSKIDMVFKSQGFCHQSLFTKVSVIKEVKFNLKYPLGADYLATEQVFLRGNHKLFYTDFPIAIFDDRTGGASHNQVKYVILERAEMFGVNKNIRFYVLYFKMLLNRYLKNILMSLFPTLTGKLRKHKYTYLSIKKEW